MTERLFNTRLTRSLALSVLLAGTASLSAPAFAAESQQQGPAAQAGAQDPVRIIAIGGALDDAALQRQENGQDEMTTDDDDEDQDGPMATQSAGRDQSSQDGQHRGQGHRGMGDQGQGDWNSRDWRSARGDRGGDRQGYDGNSHGGYDHGDGNDGRKEGDDGWSQQRRQMMAMHQRMMQRMAAGRQPPAAFRIEMGNTRIGVRCSPRETMRECVDATLSMVNRLRDANQVSKPAIGPDSSAPSPSTPSPAPSSPAPGTTAPGTANPQ